MFFCHTYFSLRYGTLSPKELVQRAQALGLRELVLCDINNTSCIFDFYQACQQAKIRAIVGIEFREKGALQFMGIARSNAGFYELNEFLTNLPFQDEATPASAPDFKDVLVFYPKENVPGKLRAFEYIAIHPSQASRLMTIHQKLPQEKLVAFHPVTIRDKADHFTHQLLQAIDQNCLLDQLDHTHLAQKNEHLSTLEEAQAPYALFPELTQNIQWLLDSCSFELNPITPKNRKTFTLDRADDKQLLDKLALDGFHQRYGNANKKASTRLNKELRVIEQLGFAAYFLITWDIIRYAQTLGYHHVGRGSGANSIVAYCMGITDVDPIELDLYFERFINPHRTSPPDFDIDFSWAERDEVTDYIFKRYGRKHVSLIATYNTFKNRAIIRELGKVFGLPKAEMDLLVREEYDPKVHHNLAEKIFKYGKRIEGFPNYLSIHAGGVIVSEKPLFHYTAMRQMPKGFPIVHFDMYVAEDWGFYKYDILSQRGLGHIKDAAELVLSNKKQYVDVHRVEEFKKDPKLQENLRIGHTLGCFYIESPAMRGLLTKLECDNYIHLVAASSIIRPGVAKSGMMRQYIHFHHHPTEVEYLHPVFKEHLEETYGVMVYQEDVMKIAHHFGGLSLDDADLLRRSMSGKSRGNNAFKKLHQQFFTNCAEKNYPLELVDEAWRQIESFSGYSFCKAHSASYAVESFQSLFLKSYFPLEFMVAVVNNFGGFYKTEIYLHEARMAGGTIQAPCVNKSELQTTIEHTDIFLGFQHLKSLESQLARSIVANRQDNGHYSSLADFVHRIPVSREQLNLLIRVGAFRFTGASNMKLLWEKNDYLSSESSKEKVPQLFSTDQESSDLPQLHSDRLIEVFEQIELLGFPLISPFSLLKTNFRGEIKAKQLHAFVNKTVRMVAYFVCYKPLRTSKGEPMVFGTWVDDTGTYFDTVHFARSWRHYPFRGSGCYLLRGKVTDDFGLCSIDVDRLARLPFIDDPRYSTKKPTTKATVSS